jgi:hypothetical protein
MARYRWHAIEEESLDSTKDEHNIRDKDVDPEK